MNYDVSAFTGHWPFRYLRENTMEQQAARYSSWNITGGCISSLDAIFFNDPWEADKKLWEKTKNTSWELSMCANPRLPWTEKRMEQACTLGIRHIRLYPGIHQYDSLEASSIVKLAGKLGMTVTITARLEDNRLCYLLQQQNVSVRDCLTLAAQNPNTRILLSGFYIHELRAIDIQLQNLYVDTAGLCHGLEPVQVLLQHVPLDRILFGSLYPLQCLESQLLNLPEQYKTSILTQNAERFLHDPSVSK